MCSLWGIQVWGTRTEDRWTLGWICRATPPNPRAVGSGHHRQATALFLSEKERSPRQETNYRSCWREVTREMIHGFLGGKHKHREKRKRMQCREKTRCVLPSGRGRRKKKGNEGESLAMFKSL